MKLDYNVLHESTCEILRACDESDENANIVADFLVRADARGITTHGTYLLTPIWKRACAKQLKLPTNAMVIKDNSAVAIVDGGDGLGAIACTLARKIAVEKASKYGVATVLIRNTNNIGSLSFYIEDIARKGMIAIMGCNAAPAMSPWGGAEAFLGTNPIAMSIYTGCDEVFSADMATSIVARGKIRKAARNGYRIPDNWALDGDGKPTTDPNEALKGTLLPMGGPKGSAIALVVDIISGMLSGSQFAPNLKSFHAPKGKTGVGAFLYVIDISHFIDLKEFKLHIVDYLKNIKNLKKASGFTEIRVPGENKYSMEQKSIKNGIELDKNAVDAINLILKQVGSDKRLGG